MNKSHHPPAWADRLLEWFCASHLLEEVQGDLHELYGKWVQQHGVKKAQWLYILHALKFFRPYSIKRLSVNNPTIMFKNYFIIALRTLQKQKLYSFINIGGLAVGLVCFILIMLYVRHELSYDRFHEQADHIYRVVEDITLSNETNKMAAAAGAVGPALVRDFPEVLRSVRFKGATMLVAYGENRFQEDNIYFTDSTIFDVFNFPLVKGDPQTALRAPFSILLSQEIAHRYFGDDDPLGKTLVIDKDNYFIVTGVFENVPSNSHLHFDILLSMTTMEAGNPGWSDAWFWSAYTYVQLAPGSEKTNLEEKLPQFIARHTSSNALEDDQQITLSLQPLLDIHLHSKRAGEPGTPGSVSNLYLFSFIAIFILLIACVNFINLTTAQAARRAREVGLRKAIGGTRIQLALQFLAESVLLTFGASVLAIVVCYLLLPPFSALVGKPITMEMFASPLAIVVFCCITLGVGCLAGSYPAFLLSGFRPASVLKASPRIVSQGSLLRQGLIVFQFSISIALIVGTVTVFSQLRYMQQQNLGYNQEQVLVLYFGDDDRVQQQVETIKQALLQSPYIDSAAASSQVPGNKTGKARTDIETASGTMQTADMNLFAVDYDFIPFYDIELAAGRAFSRLYGSDATEALMINEAGARQLGFAHPEEIVGKHFSQEDRTGTIIGVVKDFHYASLHQRIEPLVIRMRPKSLSYLSMHIRPGAITAAVKDLEKRWKAVAPHRPFDYFFLDEQFDQQYRADRQFGQVFVISAIIAIVLACLGLFGLASFTVQQRTKEIGIRKVLGASVAGVVALLSKDFIRLVLVAVVIASPIAWYAMNRWLQDFAYRIHMQWWMFVLAGILALLIAVLTVSFQSIKAALANPVDSLRNE